MIDFHTHILPEIDDGSRSAEYSVQMLKELKKQGVNKVLLTPHFYAYSSSAESFAVDREGSLNKLLSQLDNTPVEIELYLGCEALYFEELWRIENLKEFCIQGTDFILVEMPFSQWPDSYVRGIEKLVGKGLTPVIAHFDRYLRFKGNEKRIYQMTDLGAILQMNCDCLKSFLKRRKYLKFVKSGLVYALGTDCHNLEDRPPEYLKANEYLKKKLGSDGYRKFVSKQRMLLKYAKKVY
ncbi:MAG: hypothetical protein IJZ81_03835 [Clostridia bacterium]|nr:hypothetical protein [Clostridia bacterium]